ncbi:MAG: hypothetical protein AAGK04_10655 [Planctomycetota bacterium]
MSGETLVVLGHAGATWFMVGLIWFVQIVHYPLMRTVGVPRWLEYEARHTARTTWVVAPTMFVELGTAVLLAWQFRSDAWSWIAFAALGLVWAATFLWLVPLHGRLSRGHDEKLIVALARANWLRTILWSGRGVYALSLLT